MKENEKKTNYNANEKEMIMLNHSYRIAATSKANQFEW